MLEAADAVEGWKRSIGTTAHAGGDRWHRNGRAGLEGARGTRASVNLGSPEPVEVIPAEAVLLPNPHSAHERVEAMRSSVNYREH